MNKVSYMLALSLMLLIGSGICPVWAQSFYLSGNQNKTTIPFKIVRNMIIIKLSINNKGPYNFILDSGVGFMVITEPATGDSLHVNKNRTIRLAGLGSGDDYDAYVTGPLNIGIGSLVSRNVCAAIFKKDHFGLSNYAGIPIGGLLGYEFFSSLAVKINFNDSTLTVFNPGYLSGTKKYDQIPITIEDNKPYLLAPIEFKDSCKRSCKLVFDLGAGHPLSLENVAPELTMNTKSISANLGVGFNGPVNGRISRVSEIQLSAFKIRNILTSFPDSTDNCKRRIKRDGNLGFDIIKRFNIIIDYPDKVIYLKPRYNIKDPFEHDMSGMEFYSDGDHLTRVLVGRVEPGSAADDIGLEKDDELLAINLKPVKDMTLDEIDDLFRSREGRSFLLEIYRDKKRENIVLTLKRRI